MSVLPGPASVKVTKQQLFSFAAVHGRIAPGDPLLRKQSYAVFEDGVALCRLYNSIFVRQTIRSILTAQHCSSVSGRAAKNFRSLRSALARIGAPAEFFHASFYRIHPGDHATPADSLWCYSGLVFFYFMYHLAKKIDFSAEFTNDVADELTSFLQSMDSIRALVLGGCVATSQIPVHLREYCSVPPLEPQSLEHPVAQRGTSDQLVLSAPRQGRTASLASRDDDDLPSMVSSVDILEQMSGSAENAPVASKTPAVDTAARSLTYVMVGDDEDRDDGERHFARKKSDATAGASLGDAERHREQHSLSELDLALSDRTPVSRRAAQVGVALGGTEWATPKSQTPGGPSVGRSRDRTLTSAIQDSCSAKQTPGTTDEVLFQLTTTSGAPALHAKSPRLVPPRDPWAAQPTDRLFTVGMSAERSSGLPADDDDDGGVEDEEEKDIQHQVSECNMCSNLDGTSKSTPSAFAAAPASLMPVPRPDGNAPVDITEEAAFIHRALIRHTTNPLPPHERDAAVSKLWNVLKAFYATQQTLLDLSREHTICRQTSHDSNGSVEGLSSMHSISELRRAAQQKDTWIAELKELLKQREHEVQEKHDAAERWRQESLHVRRLLERQLRLGGAASPPRSSESPQTARLSPQPSGAMGSSSLGWCSACALYREACQHLRALYRLSMDLCTAIGDTTNRSDGGAEGTLLEDRVRTLMSQQDELRRALSVVVDALQIVEEARSPLPVDMVATTVEDGEDSGGLADDLLVRHALEERVQSVTVSRDALAEDLEKAHKENARYRQLSIEVANLHVELQLRDARLDDANRAVQLQRAAIADLQEKLRVAMVALDQRERSQTKADDDERRPLLHNTRVHQPTGNSLSMLSNASQATTAAVREIWDLPLPAPHVGGVGGGMGSRSIRSTPRDDNACADWPAENNGISADEEPKMTGRTVPRYRLSSPRPYVVPQVQQTPHDDQRAPTEARVLEFGSDGSPPMASSFADWKRDLGTSRAVPAESSRDTSILVADE